MRAISAVFEHEANASQALVDLLGVGFPAANLSLVMHSDTRAEPLGRGHDAGMVHARGAFLLPNTGRVWAEGPLTNALAAAERGEVRHGLQGVLQSRGIDPHQAAQLAEGVRAGGCLILIDLDRRNSELREHAYAIFEQYHALDFAVDERLAQWERGLHATRLNGHPHSVDGRMHDAARRPSLYDSDFREHFHAIYSGMGEVYEDYADAYDFGAIMGETRRYGDQNWRAVEDDLRDLWESRRPSSWDKYREAIRFGWGRVRAQHFAGPDRRARERPRYQPYRW